MIILTSKRVYSHPTYFACINVNSSCPNKSFLYSRTFLIIYSPPFPLSSFFYPSYTYWFFPITSRPPIFNFADGDFQFRVQWMSNFAQEIISNLRPIIFTFAPCYFHICVPLFSHLRPIIFISAPYYFYIRGLVIIF